MPSGQGRVGRTEGGVTGAQRRNFGDYDFIPHLGCGERYAHIKASNCIL